VLLFYFSIIYLLFYFLLFVYCFRKYSFFICTKKIISFDFSKRNDLISVINENHEKYTHVYMYLLTLYTITSTFP